MSLVLTKIKYIYQSQLRGFIINILGDITICFVPKVLSSGYLDIYIKITKKRLGCGWFIHEQDLICTINRFTLKGNCGVYRCHFSFVDFVVSG